MFKKIRQQGSPLSILMVHDLPVADGETITEGMLLRVSPFSGHVHPMATGRNCLGLYLGHMPVTGDSGGTRKVTVDPNEDSCYSVPQGQLTDAETQIGCMLDIGNDSLSVTSASNNDFRVIDRLNLYDEAAGSWEPYLVVKPMNYAFQHES